MDEPIDLLDIDHRVAHAARVYDYLLGGMSNFEVDRLQARKSSDAMGGLEEGRLICQINREVQHRAVRWLAADAGIHQFLDLGTGIPNDDMLHRVAFDVRADSRVVYVDHDPLVLAYAHQFGLGLRKGRTCYVDADLADPTTILEQAGDVLDFREPVAVMLAAILHLVADEDEPYGIVDRLVDFVPKGSWLFITHQASDLFPEQMKALRESVNETTKYRFHQRTREEVERFFMGLELLDPPGVVPADQWVGPVPARLSELGDRPARAIYAGLACKR